MMTDSTCLRKVSCGKGLIFFLAADVCSVTACYSSLSGRGDGGDDTAAEDIGGDDDVHVEVEIDLSDDIAQDGTCIQLSGDFGDCEMPLGYGFDGWVCRPFSGCSCYPYCGHFYEDVFECVSVCVDEGHCGVLHGKALAPIFFGAGDWCDEVNACLDEGTVSSVLTLFPDADCDSGTSFCSTTVSCRLSDGDEITDAMVHEFCEVTLIDGVDEVECVVWGP